MASKKLQQSRLALHRVKMSRTVTSDSETEHAEINTFDICNVKESNVTIKVTEMESQHSPIRP